VFCLIHFLESQDLVFVCPASVKDFRLSNKLVWFCKVLLLLTFESETNTEIKRQE
jgi:hypothetical protein